MHCMLITLEPQWTECEHNESGSSNCEDNTTFILTLKEQRDVSEPETCTVSGNQWELTSPIRCVLLRLKLQISMCNFPRITKTDSCILLEAKMCTTQWRTTICTKCKLRQWGGVFEPLQMNWHYREDFNAFTMVSAAWTVSLFANALKQWFDSFIYSYSSGVE